MADNSKSGLAARQDRKVQLLEAELARATERFRLAKFSAKEAKADAKAAKRDMKRARKAVIEAQEEQENVAVANAAAKKKTVSRGSGRSVKPKAPATAKRPRIAGSPETARKRRPAKRTAAAPQEALAPSESSAAVGNVDLPPRRETVEPAADVKA
jgi:hypothetical protein